MNIKQQVSQTDYSAKNRRFTAIAWALALLVLAIAVPVNLIFDRLNVTFDMSKNSLYTLTDTTKNYLSELDARGEVVDVYFLGKQEDLSEDLECLALYRTILAYEEYSCFNFMDIDPDTEPAKLQELNPDGVYNLQKLDFIFVHGSTVKRLPGKLMYTIQTNSKNQVESAEFRAENYFTGYMKTVVEGQLPTVYFLSGHNETALSEMSKLKTNLGNYNYNAEELNLTTAGQVPEDCCILVIAAPKYDITPDEYEMIYNYTANGGNITLFMPPQDSSETFPNLERLLSGYCIGMRYDRVSETDADSHSHSDPYAFTCEFAAPDTESDIDLTTALQNTVGTLPLYMPYARSFYEIYGSNYTTLSIHSLITSQKTAVSEPWGGSKLDPQQVEGQSLILSMYSMDSLRKNSKICVFGSDYIVTDEGAGNAYFIQPLQLFLSTVTWMYNSDIDMGIAEKARSYDSLNINSSTEANGLITLFVVFPLCVAAAGLVVWLRRKDA